MSPHTPSYQPSKKQPAHKMRGPRTTVLHLSTHLEPGDPGRETVDLAVLTQRAGWRALIASQGGLLVPEVERAAVRHTRMPFSKNGMLVRWRNHIQLAALIQKEHPVLLHAHGIDAISYAYDTTRNMPLPIVADFTNPVADTPRNKRLMKKLIKSACAVRVPSEYMARQISGTFSWPIERVHVIRPGIDTQWYNPGSISAERLQELSRMWRLPDLASMILMPMPFTPGGGHTVLLEALAQLKREDTYLVLVGDNRPAPAYHAEIESRIAELGLSGKVIMPDYCLDWPAACWLSNIVVAANSVPRGQGFELLVAQALGRPVIVSDCGANVELIPDANTAWLVAPDQPQAWSRALREALRLNTEERVDISQRAHNFIADTFPKPNWFNAMMGLYDSLLTSGTRRAKAAA